MSVILVNANSTRSPIANKSIHCAICSPPYWALRSYSGTATWEGGNAECDHVANPTATKTFGNPVFNENRPSREDTKTAGYYADVCPKCGATRHDNQLGLERLHDCGAWTRKDEPYIAWRYDDDTEEKTPYIAWRPKQGFELCGECFICNTLAWTREVWRVLRDDGTLWLNIGDSYASSPKGNKEPSGLQSINYGVGKDVSMKKNIDWSVTGLKMKDMCLIPARVALALQTDGWYVRCDIVWWKPNPMPESVTDRPTKSHEYVWLLSKQPRYYYDADAVREEYKTADPSGISYRKNGKSDSRVKDKIDGRPAFGDTGFWQPEGAGRNLRSVWQIATQSYSGAHYATYPEKLVEPCIKAGCPEGGIVLDPFAGSGTTGVVARRLGRSFIGLDLSYQYLHDNARTRLELDKLDAWTNGKRDGKSIADLPLFGGVG
jgi:DNA modification methylase